MPERRGSNRPGAPDRRTFPRPPLWLNLLLLVLAMGTFAYAKHHRNVIREKTAILMAPTPASPQEMNRIREELADMDVSREQLAREIDGRLEYLRTVESEQFYIAIDTQRRKMFFRLGKDIAREADVQIGAPATINAPDGRHWTFAPLKGAFSVVAKERNFAWQVPEWLYVMKGQPVPATRPSIENGLGQYVIFLPNNYVIHSQPSADSPLQGPKPGSFLVPEADLAAIWPRISTKTRVYIF